MTYHSNKYNAESACPECGGVVRCEVHCSKVNATICYAHDIVFDSSKMTEADKIRLNALGVRW